MRRRSRHEEEHANHERWLVSYADFITLMFAFFVVMYAASQSDKGSVQSMSQAVSSAFANDALRDRVAEMLGGGKAASGMQQLKTHAGKTGELVASMQQLSLDLEKEIRSGKVQVSLEPRGLVISLKEAAFFPTGDATVAPESYSIVGKVAETIAKLPNQVRLEGHTDAIPIHNGRFPSNWHLSAARSVAMLELFRDRFTIPAHRMAIVGYAETIPVDTNDTPEGRARNRRVDVTILNGQGAIREPQPAKR